VVLSDEETIIGLIKDGTKQKIQKENLLKKSKSRIYELENNLEVSVLLADEYSQCLIVGGRSINSQKSNVGQYNLKTGKLIKEYEDLNLKNFLSCKRLNNLCFYGGDNSKGFEIIDTKLLTTLNHPITSEIIHVDSLEICEIGKSQNQEKVVLAVIGRKHTGSNSCIDLFDISELVKKYKIKISKIPQTKKCTSNKNFNLQFEGVDFSSLALMICNCNNCGEPVNLHQSIDEFGDKIIKLLEQVFDKATDNKALIKFPSAQEGISIF
jgi:hypothetical protein